MKKFAHQKEKEREAEYRHKKGSERKFLGDKGVEKKRLKKYERENK